jgi:multiple sugar transport system ATP-binding protein
VASIAFEDVSKVFPDGTRAVDGLDLEIADGEFTILVGPSGSGKSTALRMVAGLEDASDGSISIGERVVDDVEAKDRNVALVFQSYALDPHLPVRKNIEFPLRTRNVPKEERDHLARDAAETLGLLDLLERKPAQLSGGQRQRVALARAIVRRPDAFLMDEPLSNLDAKLRVQTRAELIELQRRLEATILYVTHDQVEAMTMGHRIAIMSDGVLQQIGPPQSVYEKPANLFVARFIGNPAMNTVAGPIVGGAEGLAVAVASSRIPLPPPYADAVSKLGLDNVVVGVRPEHVRLASEGMLPATVSVVESLGHECHIVCRLEDGQMVIVRQQASESAPGEGSRVRLATDLEHLHVFDAHTERRIEPAGAGVGAGTP